MSADLFSLLPSWLVWLAAVLTWLVVLALPLWILFRLGNYVLGLPLRRQENSRLFLDLLDLGLRDGQRPEDTFLSLSKTGDRSLDIFRRPKSPIVLGSIHIILGAVGFGLVFFGAVTLKDLLYRNLEIVLLSLSALFSLAYTWAGIGLLRYRRQGRRLAVGLAIVDLLVGVLMIVALALNPGNDFGLKIFTTVIAGLGLPGLFLFLLTHPSVVAACGQGDRRAPPLVASLEEGRDLIEALRVTPGHVEPRLVTLLEIGRELGDLQKILPACRIALAGATGKVRKAHNYLIVIALLISPLTLLALPFMATYIFPRFKSIVMDMGLGAPPLFTWLMENLWWMVLLHGLVMLILWGGVCLHLGGARIRHILSRFDLGLGDRLALALPWKRKRLQRDFSSLLALLLDAGLPEERAVQLAAKGTANRILQRRAIRACAALENGVPLPEAIRHMDNSGEFQWRLTTAAKAGRGFLPALRAWHESLDARAFQQEQAATQLATTGLLFYNGAIVGLLMAGVFQYFTHIQEMILLW